MQALYDALCPPPEKKTITNLTEKISYWRHSDLDLLKKSKVHVIVEIIEYAPHAGVTKTILKKTTGNISIASCEEGEELTEKISPFACYVQLVEGIAEVRINDLVYDLSLGEGIVIPARTSYQFNANGQFKMISTIIKSCYEA